MIQLTFEPAFDAFHSVYRLLRLFPIIKKHGSAHRDFLRILDFYQLFPHRIESIRLQPSHQKYKKISGVYADRKPYGQQPDD
jgi:hypothetical protein